MDLVPFNREVAMSTHAHHGHHPHHFNLGGYVIGHPYAPDWLLLTIVTLAALLLWVWNS